MEDLPSPRIHRPQPRRPAAKFSLTPISTHLSPNSHSPDRDSDISNPDTTSSMPDHSTKTTSNESPAPGRSPNLAPVQHTRSVLNLTSPPLLGIYSPTEDDFNRESSTPWGNGSHTPGTPETPANHGSTMSLERMNSSQAERYFKIKTQNMPENTVAIDSEQVRSSMSKQSRRNSRIHRREPAVSASIKAASRMVVLFLLGLAYGEVIAHLHDRRNIAPVRVDAIDRDSWRYLFFWGIAGLLLGLAVPWVDGIQQRENGKRLQDDTESEKRKQECQKKGDQYEGHIEEDANHGTFGVTWNPVIRCVGAFVGIAFAIRKLPWQSTLQVSLTLALVNPAIWYLIDRTKTGLVLATIYGIVGSAVTLGINPEWVPSPTIPKRPRLPSTLSMLGISSPEVPAPDMLVGLINVETAGVVTWISSVLFCSCIFFGTVGRKLAWERYP